MIGADGSRWLVRATSHQGQSIKAAGQRESNKNVWVMMLPGTVHGLEEGWLLGNLLTGEPKLTRLCRGSHWIIRTNTCNTSKRKVKSGKCQTLLSRHVF